MAAALLCLGACGGEGESASTQSAAGSASSTSPESAEQSIEGFGEEAGGSEREAVLVAERGYLEALAERKYPQACSYFSSTVKGSLEQMLKKGAGALGCPEVLPSLLGPAATALARQQADGEISRVRVKDERAFVLFRAPGARLYVFPLVREDGEWRASTALASVLVPSL